MVQCMDCKELDLICAPGTRVENSYELKPKESWIRLEPMAMEELERKLEQSLRGLREENQTLIGLLQSRQADFYKLLHEPSQAATQEYIPRSTEPVLRLRQRPISPDDVVGVERPESPTVAREKLSSLRRDIGDSFDMCTGYRELDSQLHDETEEVDNSLISLPSQPIPKSILKNRELVDKHIKVDSRFDHSADLAADRVHKGLNYSYDDVSEETIPKWADKDMYRHATKVPHPSDEDANAERYLEHLQTQRKVNDELKHLERQRDQLLLRSSGNDRQAATIVKALAERPKNVLFDVNEADPDSLEETMKRYKPAGEATTATGKLKRFNYKNDLTASRGGRPLLGYDWIAGVLENEALEEQSDQVLEGLSTFRKQHRAECVASTGPIMEHTADLSRPISPQIEDPGHTCIHGFSVNERLFTEAVNLDDEGRSVCPVCLIPRHEPTQQEPGFVRVSIPKSTVEKAYRVKPRTRKSFEPQDSMALSHHCLKGWKSTRPSTLPTAGTLDIKDKVRAKETTTYDEARQVAESFSRMGRLLTSKEPPNERLTQRLLDANTSFRYEMETIQKLSGLNTDPYRLAPAGKA